MKKSLYAAKCIFRMRETHSRRQMYEERIVLLKADGFKDAIKQAERDAERYCDQDDGREYTGYVDVYELFDEKVENKTEIYSSILTSDLSRNDYIARFYPDISEDCKKEGTAHRWYAKTDQIRGCYHCKVVSEGRIK